MKKIIIRMILSLLAGVFAFTVLGCLFWAVKNSVIVHYIVIGVMGLGMWAMIYVVLYEDK